MMKTLVITSSLLILFLSIITSGLWGSSGWLRTAPEFNGTFFNPPLSAPDFKLDSVNGKFKKSNLQGYYALLFFGFTNCPHICPTTMAALADTLHKLGNLSKFVKVVMITIDPGRDTVERVNSYVKQFNKDFIGLSGSKDSIKKVAADFGIFHSKAAGLTKENYNIDHTSAITVLDRDGKTRLILSANMNSSKMAEDLRNLIKYR